MKTVFQRDQKKRNQKKREQSKRSRTQKKQIQKKQSHQKAFNQLIWAKRLQLNGLAIGLTGALMTGLLAHKSPAVATGYSEYDYESEQSTSFEAINIFGDSIVDAGNLFTLTSAFSTEGVPALPPSAPYAQKFSNGALWIENVANELQLSPVLRTDLAISPSTTDPADGINFAFGGALSSDNNLTDADLPALADNLSGLQEQVEEFSMIADALPNTQNSLNVISAGANDYFAALTSPESLGDLPIEQLPNVVTGNIISGLEQLNAVGAKDFIVMNLPPLEDTPFANFLDQQSEADVSSTIGQLTALHNQQLSQKIGEFSDRNPDTNVILLDANALFNEAADNPEVFGFNNTTESCLINFQPGFNFEGVCDNPGEFLFWDDVHPTATTHQIISDAALAKLQPDTYAKSVPEPVSSFALLLVGTAAVGAVAKRHRQ